MEGCFHESLIIEILSRLPVKSLLRFKSVSKSWHALIKSRYFIREQHLKQKKERHADRSIVPYSIRQANKELKPYMSRVIDTNDPDCVIHVNKEKRSSDYYICGPCDGIYFIWKKQRNLVSKDYGYYLWNPALNEEKKLPPMIKKPNMSPDMTHYYRREFIGFGFDPVTEDYKGVVIIEYRNHACPLSVMIYSLRNDSWSYAGDLSKYYSLQKETCNAFVNTSFYWLGSHDSSFLPYQYDVIIGVDLVTEARQEIGLPKMHRKDPMPWMMYAESLMVYHSSIALVAVYCQENSFNIWTLDETTSSWSKELTVKVDTSLAFIPFGYYCVNPNIMLLEAARDRRIILWDPDSNEFRNVIITNDDEEHNQVTHETVFVYVKSLIPINDRKFWERS